jgi:hypothetical protein
VANGQEANNEGSSTYIDEHREEPIATHGEHEKRRIVTSEKRSKAHNNVNNNNNGTRGHACGRRVEWRRQGCVFFIYFIYLFVNKVQIQIKVTIFYFPKLTSPEQSVSF